MRFKSIVAAAGLLAALAVLTAAPAFAQAQTGCRGHPRMRGMPCEVAQLDDAHRARGEQRRERQFVPDLSRRRGAAPAGSEQEQAGQRADGEGRDGRPEDRRVHVVPRGAAAPFRLGVGRAQEIRRFLHRLPRHPWRPGRGQLQERQGRLVRGGAVRDHAAATGVQGVHRVPPRPARRDRQAVAPPDRRRQGGLPRLPRPARLVDARSSSRPSPRSTCARAATPTSAARGSTSTRRSWKTAEPVTRRTARRTTGCSRRSRRHSARTAIRAGTPTGSTTGEGRSPA